MKSIAFLLMFVVIIGIPNIAASQPVGDEFFDTDPTQAVSEATGTTASGVSTARARPGGGAFVDGADSITTASGQRFDNVIGAELDGEGRLIKVASVEYDGGQFNHVEGFAVLADGSYTVKRAGHIMHAQSLLVDAVGVRFADNVLSAESVGSFARGDVIVGGLGGLVADGLSFFVGHAGLVRFGCLLVTNVTTTQFTSYADGLTLEPVGDEPIVVHGCGFQDINFSGDELRIAATIPASYNVIGGTLRYEADGFRERIDANASAVVEMDRQHGIACADIEPPGTYWYNADDVQQDFGVHVPIEGTAFQLCIRKHPDQHFMQYDGIIDLVAHRASLSRHVQFLKYPYRDSQPASLLMNALYSNHYGFEGSFTFDRVLGLIDTVDILGRVVRTGHEAVTTISNYYTIREAKIDGDLHRLARIEFRASPGDLTQSRVGHYRTDYFDAGITLANEILTQKAGNTTIRFLPPGHGDIARLVN